MAVSKKLKALYMGFFDGIETFTANRIEVFQARQSLRKYCAPVPRGGGITLVIK